MSITIKGILFIGATLSTPNSKSMTEISTIVPQVIKGLHKISNVKIGNLECAYCGDPNSDAYLGLCDCVPIFKCLECGDICKKTCGDIPQDTCTCNEKAHRWLPPGEKCNKHKST